ncbi:MAG: TAXI family TRAP transporter solute-binding subunit [Hyphomicrobiaceae bacterium]|nr:TAXI family TRAP transporter solute-binding subunit [Hyphomicrobiaceae bacterium]
MERNASRSQVREFMLIVGPAVILVAAAFWLAFQFVEPAPPKTVKLSAGNAAGAYYAFAERYRTILARSGITLEIASSAGSVENLARLDDASSGFKIALLQGGIADQRSAPGLVSLGRVFLEPMWVFYRGDPIDRLARLAGKRIAVGMPGSGTRVLAETLLKLNSIDASNATLVAKGGKVAADALVAGEVDAVFLALAAQSPLVDTLMRAEGVRLLSFAQAEAYSRLLPYLLPVTLPAGIVDLVGGLPPEDVTLLAAKAALVARDDTHPAILELMAAAAREVHGGGGMFQRAEEFPKAHDPEFPVADEA